jgi:multidrug transporter EmrE-like cation transporter
MQALLYVPAWAWLLASASFVGAGDYLAKKFGTHPSFIAAAVTLGTYSMGTMCFLPVLLHKNELARMGMIWYILSMLATVVIGICVFHEILTVRQWTGLVLAGTGLVLLSS